MPPMTAQCVLDAVTRSAFPVDPARDCGSVDATLLIHQYGHLQSERPNGAVVEDICHAFFASHDSGSRDWAGDMAVFSLPKFFGIAGMAGGIVAASAGLASELRCRRSAVPPLAMEQQRADRVQLRSGSALLLEQLYLRALLHPAPCPEALAGLPVEFEKVGRARGAIAAAIIGALPNAVLDDEWREMCQACLPFAIPVFAQAEYLTTLVSELKIKGFDVGLYRIDKARKMTAPDVQFAALLPCHEQISVDQVAVLLDVLQTWSASCHFV